MIKASVIKKNHIAFTDGVWEGCFFGISVTLLRHEIKPVSMQVFSPFVFVCCVVENSQSNKYGRGFLSTCGAPFGTQTIQGAA